MGLKYKDGVMIAADTLASYGSLAMFKEIVRISKAGTRNTLIGGSGEMSDYHYIMNLVEDITRENLNFDDGFEHSPQEIYHYLRAVMYQRRSKMDPLWNELVVAGYQNDAFLGVVDLRGTAYTDDVVATGFGAHLAMPILRNKWRPDLDEGEARGLLEDCLRVLFYRDCRASDMIVLSKATKDGTLISPPYKIESHWTSPSFVTPKADDDNDGGW